MRNRRATGGVIILLITFFLLGCTTDKKYGDVSVGELKARLDSGTRTVILDVRTPSELTGELGRLEEVVNIPVQVLDQRLDELASYKSEPIFVICRSGNRSRTASEILTANGFTAFNVMGGMKAWRAEFGSADK